MSSHKTAVLGSRGCRQVANHLITRPCRTLRQRERHRTRVHRHSELAGVFVILRMRGLHRHLHRVGIGDGRKRAAEILTIGAVRQRVSRDGLVIGIRHRNFSCIKAKGSAVIRLGLVARTVHRHHVLCNVEGAGFGLGETVVEVARLGDGGGDHNITDASAEDSHWIACGCTDKCGATCSIGNIPRDGLTCH